MKQKMITRESIINSCIFDSVFTVFQSYSCNYKFFFSSIDVFPQNESFVIESIRKLESNGRFFFQLIVYIVLLNIEKECGKDEKIADSMLLYLIILKCELHEIEPII